jgi:hypothetical protein
MLIPVTEPATHIRCRTRNFDLPFCQVASTRLGWGMLTKGPISVPFEREGVAHDQFAVLAWCCVFQRLVGRRHGCCRRVPMLLSTREFGERQLG